MLVECVLWCVPQIVSDADHRRDGFIPGGKKIISGKNSSEIQVAHRMVFMPWSGFWTFLKEWFDTNATNQRRSAVRGRDESRARR
jgi:hypothetical protein